MERTLMIMSFVIPVQFAYNGKNYATQMGPFNHSTEREFALTVNRRAIDDCTSLEQLKPVAKNLLEGWSSLQTAFQGLMLENIQLRQALAKREVDLRAAEEIITQAGDMLEAMQNQRERAQQSKSARRGLWPW
jgi:hypothetical protein